jgi:hypothetical protein
MARALGFKEIREELVKLRYAALLHYAKARKVEVTLTMDEFRQLNARDCVYCGGDLPFAGYGLDRKDSSRGYTLDNVVPCCRVCNRIKSDILDARTMGGIKGQLAARRLNAVLQLVTRVDPMPVRRGRPRMQHPTPKLRCNTWSIQVTENVYQEDGSVKRKQVRVRLGSADEMDFAQAKVAAEKYLKPLNAEAEAQRYVSVGEALADWSSE